MHSCSEGSVCSLIQVYGGGVSKCSEAATQIVLTEVCAYEGTRLSSALLQGSPKPNGDPMLLLACLTNILGLHFSLAFA